MRRIFCHGLACAALLPCAVAAATVDVQATGSDGKALAETVVFLESAAARAAVRPAQGVEVEQLGRRVNARVTVVPTGTSVHFPNRDKVRHHVYSFSPAKTFELKLYAGTPANPVLFDKTGIAVLGCNIHDTMVAWVVVVDTPHYGQTDALGRLRLGQVPPGSYRLRSWHAGLPPGAQPLDEALVVPAAGVSASVTLPLQGGAP